MTRFTIAIAMLSFCAGAHSGELPTGWVLTCVNRSNYVVSQDTTEFVDGRSSASLASLNDLESGCGALGQFASAGDYRGKRVRLTAFVKSEALSGWSGLWLRGDSADGTIVAFDNMQGRGIRGSTQWQQYQVVLDIPEDTRDLAYGALIRGTGKIWLDEVDLQIVDDSVAVTQTAPAPHDMPPIREASLHAQPINLGLEDWGPQAPLPIDRAASLSP